MVKFIASVKGTGKSKKLIELANQAAKTTEGNLVFIDDNKIPALTLHHSVRFVVTSGYHISNHLEFLGFICGILSQNSDIVEIFIDGLTNIVGPVENDDLVTFATRLKELSEENNVEFVITINKAADTFPQELSGFLYNA
ncbi:MAG: hypothetical protein FWD96_06825 [Defluviitaleaceae bacterium]|nr:hypothetical protein [Defluviitaleaceae bacterium]